MRKSWPFALAVVVVGAIAGVAIAGRPVPSDPFVLDPSITVPTGVTSGTQIASTSPTKPTAATVTTTLATSTTTAVLNTAVPNTAATTAVAATTTVPSATTTIAGPLPRDQVSLLIANADGRFRLATITADRIIPLGYPIVLSDTLQKVAATTIYYRPGFDDEAAIVASDILVPNAIIAPLPPDAPPITSSDDGADVIVLLGPDAPR
jgi:hypothetical protein